jgi:hypothetical protein
LCIIEESAGLATRSLRSPAWKILGRSFIAKYNRLLDF